MDLALDGFAATMKCTRPLENSSVGKLMSALINLAKLADTDDRCGGIEESLHKALIGGANHLSREGEVRDGGRTRWYWEKYHPKKDGKPANTPCPKELQAFVCDYTVELAYWMWEAARLVKRL